MKVAITGGTGFIGRYIVAHLHRQGHALRGWCRKSAEPPGLQGIDWIHGRLAEKADATELVAGCDAVVHAALWKPGANFRGGEGDVVEFARVNILGTLQLIEAAREAGARKFVFVSTCAVHEQILDDRPLDERHPLWPLSHYGAHKAAVEQFVHSYGLGQGYSICAVRPTGVYGIADPPEASKWFALVHRVAKGQTVRVSGGGKEVHAADVAKAIGILLAADNVHGQAYNCYDMYVSQFDVATIARRLANSDAQIVGESNSPRHQIRTEKLRSLGMNFGGLPRLEETIGQMLRSGLDAART